VKINHKFGKRKKRKQVGASPGTLVHVGEQKAETANITILDYSEAQFEEKQFTDAKDSFPFKDRPSVSWINLDGLHNVNLIEDLGQHFGIHSLVLEDCLDTTHRPKLDDYDSYLFVVLKMLYLNSDKSRIEDEQISLILGQNFVISLQEKAGDVFTSVRERIRAGKGRIRKAKADYLMYTLIDAVVDNYFVVVDELNEKIDQLDTEVIENPSPETLQNIYHLKRRVVEIRKSVSPLRDVISRLQKGDPELLDESTEIYFGDVFDHILQVIESIDADREILSGLIDLYLSSVSNRTNEVMKVLTIMATIFIPLTFIVGVYGMNFEYMPELKWHYAYPLVWLIMLIIAAFMLFFFRKRRWI